MLMIIKESTKDIYKISETTSRYFVLSTKRLYSLNEKEDRFQQKEQQEKRSLSFADSKANKLPNVPSESRETNGDTSTETKKFYKHNKIKLNPKVQADGVPLPKDFRSFVIRNLPPYFKFYQVKAIIGNEECLKYIKMDPKRNLAQVTVNSADLAGELVAKLGQKFINRHKIQVIPGLQKNFGCLEAGHEKRILKIENIPKNWSWKDTKSFIQGAYGFSSVRHNLIQDDNNDRLDAYIVFNSAASAKAIMKDPSRVFPIHQINPNSVSYSSSVPVLRMNMGMIPSSCNWKRVLDLLESKNFNPQFIFKLALPRRPDHDDFIYCAYVDFVSEEETLRALRLFNNGFQIDGQRIYVTTGRVAK